MVDTGEEDTIFTTSLDVSWDPEGALEQIQQLRTERDQFAHRLNRLDEELNLRSALKERLSVINANIKRDRQQLKFLNSTSDLRSPEAKRARERIKEREQVEWYKHDELVFIAGRAGVEL